METPTFYCSHCMSKLLFGKITPLRHNKKKTSLFDQKKLGFGYILSHLLGGSTRLLLYDTEIVTSMLFG